MRYILLTAIFFSVSILAYAQPSANEIVFQTGFNTVTSRPQVYSIRANGSGQVNLTNDPANRHLLPHWSPDGTKIVLTINNNIWVMNANGTNRMQVTRGAGGSTTPVWSPDGRRIAFVYDGFGFQPPSINVIDADGGNYTELVFTGSYDNYFGTIDWSPDGSKIIFSMWDAIIRRENIYVMNADGSGQTVLTNTGGHNFHPKWSPDGSRIAFSSGDGDLAFASTGIYVMHADGSNRIMVTNSFAHNEYPSWSPDGLKLAFSSDRDGLWNIYVMNVDGTNIVQVTQNGLDNLSPNWKRAPSAQRKLSGRVTTPDGRGLSNAVVSLTDSLGVRRTATSSFGYYSFDNITPGKNYTIAVSSRRFKFQPLTLTINENLANVDLAGRE